MSTNLGPNLPDSLVSLFSGADLRSRVGMACARSQKMIEQHLCQDRISRDVEFNEVFAGIAARGAEEVEPGGNGEIRKT